ncbi:14827_t:CDS:2, partial [Racocetra persica]
NEIDKYMRQPEISLKKTPATSTQVNVYSVMPKYQSYSKYSS